MTPALEVGKSYRTRNGSVVRLTEKLNSEEYHFRGILEHGADGYWRDNGRYFRDDTEDPFDIVEAVVE